MIVDRSVTEAISASVSRFARLDPSRPALICGRRIVDYAELAALIDQAAAHWSLPPRSLVVLGGGPSLEFVVAYLSLLSVGHVPLLAGERTQQLTAAWRPAAIATADPAGLSIERCEGRPHDVHDELALVLSTSGSTGSPKLVRLSHNNLAANAFAIADYLSLTEHDRAITTLPLHYCYGLSVLHSHLVVGASVVVTSASVVDPCFRDSVENLGVTNVAGVPHTFDLLERSHFEELATPRLRLMTVAGGRMAADDVRSWAQKLARRGVELFVMYGQTEATARMAYLPPRLAADCPQAIGVPIPGGAIELRPHPAASVPGVGEIVYRGPNVMMGYAKAPADLARGHDLDELCTGDLARRRPDGMYEIVGRVSRFIKLFGLRVDLDHLEAELDRTGLVGDGEIIVVGDDTALVVAISNADVDLGAVRAAVLALTSLPARRVRVVQTRELPRTECGKVDALALMGLAADPVAPAPETENVAAVFRFVLGREVVCGDETFVSLGGDSLSYVECGLRLETLLGRLPDNWHVLSVAELQSLQRSVRRTRLARLDMTVLLRAFAICAVVATHMLVYRIPGGAHLLLAVVGYNFARFQLAIDSSRERLRAGLRTAVRVAAPTSAWIAINMLIVGGYSVGALALVNNYTGSSFRRDGRWQYWFFEVFVQLVLITTVLMAIPAMRRVERSRPFLVPMLLLLLLLAFRFRWLDLGDHYNYLFRTHTVAWFFALGWAIRRATRAWQRVLVSAIAIVAVAGFFGRTQRELVVMVGLLALTWISSIPIPRWLLAPISTLASASMWIFLVHWQVWPPMDALLKREVAFVLTLAIGVAVWWIVARVTPLLRTHASARSVAGRYSQVKPSSGAFASGSIR